MQRGAGIDSAFTDEEYAAAGADLVDSAAETWNQARMVVKVKEPQAEEYGYLRNDLLLFTYLHLAADETLTRELLKHGVTGLAYETVTDDEGRLPLLEPMSEVAGADGNSGHRRIPDQTRWWTRHFDGGCTPVCGLRMW